MGSPNQTEAFPAVIYTVYGAIILANESVRAYGKFEKQNP